MASRDLTNPTLHLTIDLAERYSAALLLDATANEVVGEWVSDLGPASAPPRPIPHLEALEEWHGHLAYPATLANASGGLVVIEDVHPFAINPKPILRLQGLLLHLFAKQEIEPVLLMPTVWQKHLGYKYKKGRSSKGWAKELCLEMGYLPGKALAAGVSHGKNTVDLRDARLIARFITETHGPKP